MNWKVFEFENERIGTVRSPKKVQKMNRVISSGHRSASQLKGLFGKVSLFQKQIE
jgi:hypothetical protein